jgi:hypothetical protein
LKLQRPVRGTDDRYLSKKRYLFVLERCLIKTTSNHTQ